MAEQSHSRNSKFLAVQRRILDAAQMLEDKDRPGFSRDNMDAIAELYKAYWAIDGLRCEESQEER
jgi:hypothetical protein